MMANAPQTRDIVVLGASAGGFEVVSQVLADLPADTSASVFVVIHMGVGVTSHLPEILTRRGPLRATHPLHGEDIQPGRIYVAPPDMHLMLRPGYMHVLRGAKENGHRPAVDTLFRTAAIAYGPRVIGAVLSGYLDCGTAGLLSIKARGGIGIAQNPRDASVGDMPRSAIEHTPVDHVVDATSMGALITRLTREPAGEWPAQLPSHLKEFEGQAPGVPVEIVCPSCQGTLTKAQVGNFELFRCHVGHTFSLASMVAEQAHALERALWAAARALEESASLAGRMAARVSGGVRQKFEEKQDTQLQHARKVRSILDGAVLHETDYHDAEAPRDTAQE